MRVVAADRHAKIAKGLRRTLTRGGVLHGQMAKVQLRVELLAADLRFAPREVVSGDALASDGVGERP